MALITFTAVQEFSSFASYGPVPPLVYGTVLFAPVFRDGDVALTAGQTPPLTLLPAAVQAKIVAGVLCAEDGSVGVVLPCAQAALGLSSTLAYTVTYSAFRVGNTQTQSPSAFTFNASATGGATVDLHDVSPVPATVASGVFSIASGQISDASTIGLQVLTAADAATARGFLGVSGSVSVVNNGTGTATISASVLVVNNNSGTASIG